MALFTFRRMLLKVPDILLMWRLHYGHFHSPFLPGPYTKLMNFFGLIGWSVVDPPWIADHQGCLHNLITQDRGRPLVRLEDAWAQDVARRVKHAHMSQLDGIGLELSHLNHHKLEPRARLRVSPFKLVPFWPVVSRANLTKPNPFFVRSVKTLMIDCTGTVAPNMSPSDSSSTLTKMFLLTCRTAPNTIFWCPSFWNP